MEICNFTIMGLSGCKAILWGIGIWFGIPIAIVIVYIIVVIILYFINR